ncbi:hypothetical protein [Streptomyces luteireticuli]|uniref:hypothetical protein n=1 Tax=Streptomyces luteireticuli TaxID=173858 RepID=UPI003558781A
MNPLTHRAALPALTAALITALLTGCSGSTAKNQDKSDGDVVSLRTPGDAATSQNPTTPSGKKYKPGSKELDQAVDEWRAKIKSCVAKAAQQHGIPVTEGTGKNEGDLVAKGPDIGFGQDVDGKPTYTSPLAKKWFEEVQSPCRKENPAPELDDDKDTAARLAEARKKYECLRKEGLDELHEPTADALAPFTPKGTSKYMGQNPDPKSQQALKKCGLNHS